MRSSIVRSGGESEDRHCPFGSERRPVGVEREIEEQAKYNSWRPELTRNSMIPAPRASCSEKLPVGRGFG